MRLDKTSALGAALALLGSTTTFAAVFAEKSPEQKLRADIALQVGGYTKCLATALINCEKTGALAAPECSVQTGSANAPADPKAKLAAAIARCDAKLDYERKAPKGNTPLQSYTLIGCPGDSSGAFGQQRFSDLIAYQGDAATAKGEIDTLASFLPSVSGCSDTKSCVAAAKVVLGYATAFGKCQTACENDYKNRKGNGGGDDSVAQCGPTGDAKVVACIDKARGKLTKKTVGWPAAAGIAGAIESIIDDQSDELFNVAPNCF